MSKIKEILERVEVSNGSSLEKSVVTSEESLSIWPRFRKVREAVKVSLSQREPVGVKRDFNSFDWSGHDSGIHDHKGKIEGEVNGIKLNFTIKGVTVDHNPKYVINSTGELILEHRKEQYFDLIGKFISVDGRNGEFNITFQNKKPIIEGYWLQIGNGLLRLEQVINPEGQIFDANTLEDSYRKDVVKVPGTRTELNRFIQG